MSAVHASASGAPAAKAAARAIAPAASQRQCACAVAQGEDFCADCGGRVQRHAAGYAVGAIDDPLEREADRAAEAVVAGRAVGAVAGQVSSLAQVQRSAVYTRTAVGSSGRIKAGKLVDWDYVVYEDHVRLGNRVFDKNTGQTIGSWPWLTNNPGDITVDPKEAGKARSSLNRAYEWGAVAGQAASTGHIPLAIFPDGATGAAALKKLYAEPEYRDKTLKAAIEVHLGRKETRVPGVDDPQKYLDIVKERAKKLGVKDDVLNKTLAELDAAGAMDALVAGFGAAEGYENVGVTYTCDGRDKSDDAKIPQTVRNLGLFKNLPDAAPDEVLRLLGCKVPSGGGAQRKAADRPVANSAAQRSDGDGGATVAKALGSGEAALPANVRKLMEARFGHDFSQVRVHTDDVAQSSARNLAARAYAVGHHIVFAAGEYAPATTAGQKLLAHELTHVIQQDRGVAPKLRRAPEAGQDAKPAGKFYQEVIDNIAYADRQMDEQRSRGELVHAPLNYASLKALLKLCEAVEQNAWDVVPTRLDAFLKVGVMAMFHTISEPLLAELSARIHEQGLESDAQRLRKAYTDDWRHMSLSGTDPASGQRDLQLYERLIGGAIDGASVATPAQVGASLKRFARAFAPLRDAYAAIDREALEWERQSGSGFRGFRPAMSHQEWESALSTAIARWLGGLEGFMQQAIDAARADLESGKASGAGSALLVSLRDAMRGELAAVLFPDDPKKDLSHLLFDITRTTLGRGKGVITDSFAKDSDKKKRTVEITTYDPEQERVQEMKSSLEKLYTRRLDQIASLGYLYGATDLLPAPADGGTDLTGDARANAAVIASLKDGKLRLDSDDDWRAFVLAKYRALVAPPPAPATGDPAAAPAPLSPAQALRGVMDTLFAYLRNFTMHAHYTNIYDLGDSYVNKPFPRALSGQLVHDCGVYAIRAAYILSLVRSELKLKFRFVFMPAHVGLVIEGDGLPTYFIQNDSFMEVSPESMAGGKQTFERFTQPKSFSSSEGGATVTITMDAAPPGKRDHTQLIGELSTGIFIGEGADMPFRVVDIPEGATPKAGAAQLWNTYESATREGGLFGRAVGDKKDPGYLFHQRYLGLIEESRTQYNEKMVPFWNESGPGAWATLNDAVKPKPATDAKAGAEVKPPGDPTGATLLAPVRAYADAIGKSLDKLADADKHLADMADRINDSLAANPKLRGSSDSRLSVGKRSKSLFQSSAVLQSYRHEVAHVIAQLKGNPDAKWKVDELLKRLRPPFVRPGKRLEFLE